MVSEEKLKKIKRMMKASGIMDNFEKLLRASSENVLAHLNELESLTDEEDFVPLDGASLFVKKKIDKIKKESKELYLQELIANKEKIFDAIAMMYDQNLNEDQIDAFYELYSSDTWKEIAKFQPVLLEQQFSIMSKFDIDATMKTLKFAMPKELDIRAKYLAKLSFGRAIERGASMDAALATFGDKYRQIIEEG